MKYIQISFYPKHENINTGIIKIIDYITIFTDKYLFERHFSTTKKY